MAVSLANFVRVRAQGRFEYCRLPESVSRLRHVIDHVIARQHHGAAVAGNLALGCGECNRAKGPNIAGLDPVDGALPRLFNPRVDVWSDHLTFDPSGMISGQTPVGRVTVYVFAFNLPARVATRAELAEEGFRFD